MHFIFEKSAIEDDPRGEVIAKLIMEQYKPGSREEAQEAIKDIFGPIFEAMLQGEMEEHLGYATNDHGSKETDNRCNGYVDKTVRTAYGEIPVSVPRDRDVPLNLKSSPNEVGM